MKEVFQLGSGITVLVDDEDWDLAIKYKWRLRKGYPNTVLYDKVSVDLHKLIADRMGLIGEIDHEDRNKLNCQRNNLRSCNHSQNLANRGANVNNTSGAKGVRFEAGRYRAQIQVAGKHKFLGYFSTIEEAKRAYARAAKKHFGDYVSNE